MAVKHVRNNRSPAPLDPEGLDRLALAYAGRYATTRAKLRAYLRRKLAERGWAGDGEPQVDPLVERFAGLGYVDDQAFAAARAAALGRRGYGQRRVAAALRAAGIEDEDSRPARNAAERSAWSAALRFAERRKIGPFARSEPDRIAREKAFGAMLRAGHPAEIARRMIAAPPGEIPETGE